MLRCWSFIRTKNASRSGRVASQSGQVQMQKDGNQLNAELTVMARFGPGNLIEGAPFSEVIPRARPPGRGEHVSGVS